MGVIPATLQVLAYLQRTLFLPKPAHGQLLGRLASQVVEKLLHTIKEAL